MNKRSCLISAFSLQLLAFISLAVFTLLAIFLSRPKIQNEFTYDFSTEKHWSTFEDESRSIKYDMDGLRITIDEPNIMAGSTTGIQFNDVEMMVDAKKISGADINFIGLICRYQDNNNYYVAVVSSDQTYAIFRRKDGQPLETISEPIWMPSNTINKGNALNQIKFSCEGKILALSVNGKVLDLAVADDFDSGQVGLLVKAYEEGGVDILFDNFSYKRIDDE